MRERGRYVTTGVGMDPPPAYLLSAGGHFPLISWSRRKLASQGWKNEFQGWLGFFVVLIRVYDCVLLCFVCHFVWGCGV